MFYVTKEKSYPTLESIDYYYNSKVTECVHISARLAVYSATGQPATHRRSRHIRAQQSTCSTLFLLQHLTLIQIDFYFKSTSRKTLHILDFALSTK